MALETATEARPTPARRPRLPGPDVVRAVALIGVVVMNYHGYLIIDRGDGDVGNGWAAALFDPWSGPLTTRFAATFVLVAGVGVALMTRRARTDAALVTAMRWRLVRRGAVLYVAGLFIDLAWPGSIIPFYGAMFVLAAAMFTWRSGWILLTGFVAALAGWAISTWRFQRIEAGGTTVWLTNPDEGSIEYFVYGVFVNGTHPLLPWLAFFCTGIALGRVLDTSWWRPVAIGLGALMFAAATLLGAAASTDFEQVFLSTDPLDRGMLYTASALGTALVAYAVIDWCATRFPAATDPLRRAGQLTLSLYLLHIFVYYTAVDWFGWIEPAGLDVALTFALVYWVVAIAAANAWSRRYGAGPAERAYRILGG